MNVAQKQKAAMAAAKKNVKTTEQKREARAEKRGYSTADMNKAFQTIRSSSSRSPNQKKNTSGARSMAKAFYGNRKATQKS